MDGPSGEDYIGTMSDVSVSLPADLQSYVDARVAQEGFADSADFLRDLVRRDQDEYEADVRRVQQLIQEGIDSGIVDAEPEDILDEILADMHLRHG
jgi:antitoxin ParD1/3/4